MERLLSFFAKLKGFILSRPFVTAGVVLVMLLVWVTGRWLTRSSDHVASAKSTGVSGQTSGFEKQLAAMLDAQRHRTGLGQWELFDYVHDAKPGEKFVAMIDRALKQPPPPPAESPESWGRGFLDLTSLLDQVANYPPPQPTQPRVDEGAQRLQRLSETQIGRRMLQQFLNRPAFDRRAAQREVEADVREAVRDFNQNVYGGP